MGLETCLEGVHGAVEALIWFGVSQFVGSSRFQLNNGAVMEDEEVSVCVPCVFLLLPWGTEWEDRCENCCVCAL